MRKDMPKVITERPRVFGGIKSPKGSKKLFAKTPLDEQPKREKIRQKWHQSWQTKEFSERLGPLYRWINSQLGRPWDKVYSEVREVLSYDSVIQSHVMTHLFQYVELDAVIIGKVPYHRNVIGSLVPVHNFYVDPRTRILRKAPQPRRIKRKSIVPIWLEAEKLLFRKIGDIWHVLEMKAINKNEEAWLTRTDWKTKEIIRYRGKRYYWDDAVLGDRQSADQLFWGHGVEMVCVSKRHARKKELRQLKRMLLQSGHEEHRSPARMG